MNPTVLKAIESPYKTYNIGLILSSFFILLILGIYTYTQLSSDKQDALDGELLEFYLEEVPKLEEADNESAKILAFQALRISDSTDNALAQVESLFWLAKIHLVDNRYGENAQDALTYAKMGLSISQKIDAQFWILKFHTILSSIYSYGINRNKNYYDSMDIHLESAIGVLPSYKGTEKDSLLLAADILKYKGSYVIIRDSRDKTYSADSIKKSNNILKESLRIYKEVENLEGQGICYRNLGFNFGELNQDDSSLFYFDQSLSAYKLMGARNAQGRTYQFIGDLHRKNFLDSKSNSEFNRAISYYRKANDAFGKSSAKVLLEMGKLYHYAAYFKSERLFSTKLSDKQLIDSTWDFYNESLKAAGKESNLVLISDAIQAAASICAEKGKKQLFCMEFIKQADGIYKEVAQKGRSAQVKAEKSLQDYRFKSFAKSKKIERMLWLWYSGALVIFAFCSFALILNHLKVKRTREEVESRLKALQAQMNPHFISNSLNSIESLINQKKNREASEYLIDFSDLARMVLGFSQKDKIPISQELSMLKLYLSLETLRMNGKLDYQFLVDDNLNLDEVQIPPMLLQPFIENAIWHGIKYKNSPGMILINFIKVGENQLLCMVEDDGVGRKKAEEIKSQSMFPKTSYSTQIIQERVKSLKSVKGADLRIIDLKNEKGEASGTRVEILLSI